MRPNRLTNQTGPENFTIAYDPVGNIETITDLAGTTSYTYTDLNMLGTVTDPWNGVTTYSYDPARSDRRTQVQYPTGVTTGMTYDEAGRVTGVTSRNPGGSIIDQHTYTFTKPVGGGDSALRQTWTADAHKTTYEYDPANRLKRAERRTVPSNVVVQPTYEYTYNGDNRNTFIKGGVTTNYTHNDADQLTSGGATHDANGNMTATTDYGLTGFSYNSVNQTTSLTPKTETARAQTYSGTSQTHWRSNGPETYANVASLGITAITNAGSTSYFTREPDGTLISMRRAGQTYHYLYDGRGSVSGLTNSSGAKVNTYTYEPYGRTAVATEGVLNPFRFNAGYTHNGIVYKYGARFYDSSLGRWTQVDSVPSEPRYAFAGNDPVNKSDPSGYGIAEFAHNVVDEANDVVDRVVAPAAKYVSRLNFERTRCLANIVMSFTPRPKLPRGLAASASCGFVDYNRLREDEETEYA